MSSSQISTEKFDSELRATFVEVSSAALGGEVVACSDDFFASKDNLIKPSASISLKGQFGPNGALYDGWESRRHNPTYDWAIIRLAPERSHLHYVDIDTSHFSGNEAPYASVFALYQESELAISTAPGANDNRWEEILPVVELGPNQRHIFPLGQKAVEGQWNWAMVRMIPDGGMARFRAYGRPIPPAPLKSLPEAGTPPVNLLSPLSGAHIVSCSDANFSPPGNLLLPGRGVDMSDGWETRRSQEARGKYAKGGALDGQERKEWVIAKLAGTGVVQYVEVDTAFHPGNYPTACMVEATLCDEVTPPADQKWTTIVAKKPLGAHRQHWLDIERSVPPDAVYSHVRLSIFPDGGLKRLRIFGHPLAPSPPAAPTSPLTIPALPLTAEAFKPYGDVIQGYSLPTSAPKGVETTIANQGTAYKFNREASIAETYPVGMLKKGGLGIGCVRGLPFFETRHGAVLDVKMLERHACTSQAFIPMGKSTPPGVKALPSGGGFVVVAALNGKDDKPDLSTIRAFLATAAQGVNFHQGIWHHSLLTVDAPMDYACVEAQVGDAGLILDCEIVKPMDVFCKVTIAPYTSSEPSHAPLPNGHPHPHPHPHPHHAGALETLSHLLPALPPAIEHSLHADSLIHPTPISPEAFAPYGNIIVSYPDEATRPGAMIVTGSLKTGKAEKYTRLAPILSTYPEDAGAVTSIGVYRATKKVGLERGKVFDIRLMERHAYTTQAFIPMGKAGWTGYGEESLPPGGAFLVVVAKNGHDDRPDPNTIKAFIMESSSGLSYAAGTWHHPVLVLDSTLDLACIETQIHTGLRESDPRDCELLQWSGEDVFGRIAVPALEESEE